jgi:hypothetical protein
MRICLTPGAIYSIGANDTGTIHIQVRFPKGGNAVKQFMNGEFSVMTEGEGDKAKLARYEEAFSAQSRIAQSIHDVLEPFIAEIYRTIWTTHIAGQRIDGRIMPATYDEYIKQAWLKNGGPEEYVRSVGLGT